MTSIRDWPVRRKLLLLSVLPSTLGLVLVCSSFMIALSARFPTALERELGYVAEIVGDNSSAALLFSDPELAGRILASLSASPRIVAAHLYDAHGAPFAHYYREGAERGRGAPDFEPSGSVRSGGNLGVFRTITSDGEPVGGIYVESDMVEMGQQLREYATVTVAFVLLAGLLAAAIARKMQAWISLPLQHVASSLSGIAQGQGDLSRTLAVASRDEVGEVARSFNSFVRDMRIRIAGIAQHSEGLTASAHSLRDVSEALEQGSGESSLQATAASAASEQVSRNLQSVATASEELNASIREIAKNASNAARVASGAVEVAERTTATVSRLGDSSAEIGNVTRVITSIAEQTNLLALNAAIEAARAGEAGRGFAVVANEVKELARETARATEDITSRIDAAQADTQNAVEAIRQITQVINEINDLQNVIASEVEEQTATTNEIGRNVSQAAEASGEIAQSITRVARSVENTASGASGTLKAAQQLATMAGELQGLVGRFRYHEDEDPAPPRGASS